MKNEQNHSKEQLLSILSNKEARAAGVKDTRAGKYVKLVCSICNEVYYKRYTLYINNIYKHKCLPGQSKIKLNEAINYLIPLEYINIHKYGRTRNFFKCKCIYPKKDGTICGNITFANSRELTKNKKKSCGCLQVENAISDTEKKLGQKLEELFKINLKPQWFVDGYKFDFYWQEGNILIESDGPWHLEARDLAKNQAAKDLGFPLIIRMMVYTEKDIEKVIKYNYPILEDIFVNKNLIKENVITLSYPNFKRFCIHDKNRI